MYLNSVIAEKWEQGKCHLLKVQRTFYVEKGGLKLKEAQSFGGSLAASSDLYLELGDTLKLKCRSKIALVVPQLPGIL